MVADENKGTSMHELTWNGWCFMVGDKCLAHGEYVDDDKGNTWQVQYILKNNNIEMATAALIGKRIAKLRRFSPGGHTYVSVAYELEDNRMKRKWYIEDVYHGEEDGYLVSNEQLPAMLKGLRLISIYDEQLMKELVEVLRSFDPDMLAEKAE